MLNVVRGPETGRAVAGKHQAHGRFIQPLHSPSNLPVWGTRTPPQAPISTAAHARTPDSRRHPARQTHLAVPVAQSHCASGSGFPQIAHRWSTRRALEPGGDPANGAAPVWSRPQPTPTRPE